MRKIFFYLACLLMTSIAWGQDFPMDLGNNGQTFNTCSGNFYDSGGVANPYTNNEDRTITFCPTAAGQLINIAFSSFNVQGTTGACTDLLEYWFAPTPGANGTGTPLCGNLGAFNLASTSVDGCISFRFFSDASITRVGWAGVISCTTAPACAQPTGLTVTGITATGANVAWTQPNGAAAATQWQIFVGPPGGPAPVNNPTTTPVSNPHTLTGLTGLTAYCVYVRAICANGNGFSEWTGPQCFTTGVPPLGCGGIFTDTGGVAGIYGPNENGITTICPDTPGQVVQVNFTAFQTETSWDRLYVYNGSTIASPLIPSTNGGGSGPCNTVPGGWWNNQLLNQTIVSTSPDGCLTFRFCSDGSVQQAGWVATVACIPGPACANPSNITVTAITHNSAQIAWTENGVPPSTQWEVIIVPTGSPAPSNAAAIGTGTVTSLNPFPATNLSGLTTYQVYVRAICAGGATTSFWGGPQSFVTPAAPLGCGVTFTDSGGPGGNYSGNENITYTICPPVGSNQLVQVTFNVFNTEANWDRLYVYNSNTIGVNQITTIPGVVDVPNGGGFGAGCNTVTGGFWGTQLQGQTITATNNSGCLVFRFCSDGSVNLAGWSAAITCIPAPGCLAPSGLTVANITNNSATLSWSDNGVPPSTQWEYILQAANLAPPSNATAVNPANIVTSSSQLASNLVNCQLYRFYVRAICANGNGNSFWTASQGFGTPAVNDNCANAVTVPVNADASCAVTIPGCLTGATASTQPNACPGTADDDVWFSFTASGSSHIISLLNIVGSTTDLAFGIYSGACTGLTQVQCSAANSGVINGLTAGTTYFIRVYSETATPGQSVNFDVCVGTIPSCSSAVPFCTDTGVTFNNSVGVPSLGQIGCLFTTPNPAWFFMEIGTSGNLHLNIAQQTPGGVGLDVDYVVWGPFASNAAACAAIPANPLPDGDPPGLPALHGCSYSIAPVEYVYIPNVVAGQVYVVLITNFSNQAGTITFNNINGTGTATTDCTIVCPDVTVGPDVILCDATQHTVTAVTTTTPTTYQWFFNNTLIPGANTNQGTFTVSGTYKCVVTKAGCPDEEDEMVLTFNTSQTPIFDAVGPFCSGATIAALPTTSNNGIAGTWSPAINNSATTTYTFTPTAGQCATTTTLQIVINNCTFSGYASAVWIDDCTNQANADGEFYNISGTGTDIINQTPDRDFNTRNYGTFASNSSQLLLRGGEVKTIKNNGVSNVCTPKLLYRVYQTGSPNGVFQPVGGWDIAFRANCDTGLGNFSPFSNAPCNNPGQQIWQCVTQAGCNPSVDLTAFPAGNYTLEVYFEVPGSATTNNQCNELFLINNGGSNYTATFTIIDAPLVATTPATCSAPGTANVSNYNPLLTYSSTPPGITVGAGGLVTGFTCGTSYTITATILNSCTATSTSFVVPCQLPTPAAPVVTTTPASCSANGTATITNYNSAWTYTFNPLGPTVGSSGLISGLVCGNNYTVTVTNGSNCTSAVTPLGIACQLPTPAVPTVSTTAATCSAPGSATVSNYDATLTYSSTPAGITVAAGGVISGFICGTPYTITATNGSTCFATSSSFTIECQLPTISPIFTQVAPICAGAALSALPGTSNNGVTGTWSPAMDNQATTTYTFTPTAGLCATTQTMTIVVNPNVVPAFTQVAPICLGATLSALPPVSNNGVTGTWSPALNNQATTTYTFTPTAGLCATTQTMTIVVNPNVVPAFTQVAPICAGATLSALPPVSNNGVTGTWSPALNNQATTTYTFTPTAGQCATTTTMSITVIPNNTVSIASSEPIACINADTISITHTTTGATGIGVPTGLPTGVTASWSNGTITISGVSTQAGTFNYSIPLIGGCGNINATGLIAVGQCQIPQGISPNNDGKNDTWDLEFLNARRVEIFNRYGMQVYSRDNYRKEFGGISNDSQVLPDGTYFYIISLANENKSGWLYINRERK
jgi:gliding motility-associated-like protein